MRSWIWIGLLIAAAGQASAQPCVLGLYVDRAGQQGHHDPLVAVPFEVYLVLHVENAVTGVAFSVDFPSHILFSVISYGPSGGGINVPRNGAENVGLGECAIGFNQMPIVVASYVAVRVPGPSGRQSILVGPNLDEHPEHPVYATCADQLIPCEHVSELALYGAATESRSFGAVKSLY